MSPEIASKVVAVSVVPIIVISACGLLCLAFYNRMAAVVARLRAFQRERLHEQDSLSRLRADGDATRERHVKILAMLADQTVHVVKRARLIRATLALLLVTIVLMSLCSLLAGASVVFPNLAFVEAGVFVLAMVCLIAAIGCALLELRAALDPIELEQQFVTHLNKSVVDLEPVAV